MSVSEEMEIAGWASLSCDAGALPQRFVAPADDGTPHPLAAAAAQRLLHELATGVLARGIDFHSVGAGKMFGVLVVVDANGEPGCLRGFSGMIGQRWNVAGFVPPLFDAAALATFWPAGELEVDAMTQAIAALEGDERAAMIAARRERSRELWARIQTHYRIADAHGRVRTNAELFAPAAPPGGAGDCAGPKLIAAAYRNALRPLALAEVWWGAPMGERTQGTFHAPCATKCGPILRHMLAGA
ncbi:MAG TPA: hypothetical protein VG755_35075 [Nannocystaceae bacterium]|nr:hypothetical protein [Nannocystaceae bacterium]